jgi:hypothetical protein
VCKVVKLATDVRRVGRCGACESLEDEGSGRSLIPLRQEHCNASIFSSFLLENAGKKREERGAVGCGSGRTLRVRARGTFRALTTHRHRGICYRDRLTSSLISWRDDREIVTLCDDLEEKGVRAQSSLLPSLDVPLTCHVPGTFKPSFANDMEPIAKGVISALGLAAGILIP